MTMAVTNNVRLYSGQARSEPRTDRDKRRKHPSIAKRRRFIEAVQKFLFVLSPQKPVRYNSYDNRGSESSARRDHKDRSNDSGGNHSITKTDAFWVLVWLTLILTAARYGYVIAERAMGA